MPIIRTFHMPNGRIEFDDDHGSVRATYYPMGGGAARIYEIENIYVNVNNSPNMTTPFSNHDLAWQLEILNRFTDMSLGFFGSIVITNLPDWSHINKQTLRVAP